MKNLKVIITLLFFVISTEICVLGQELEENTRPKKWRVGLSFSPDHCYRNLQSGSASEVILKNRNDSEIAKFGYTAGASILWRIHRMFELESGLRYSDKGYKTDKHNLSWVSDDMELPSKYRIVYRYQYFDIPVKLNYYLINKKLQLFLTTGFSVNIFNRQLTKLILEKTNGTNHSMLSENDLGFSTLNFSIFVGGGILYPVAKSLSLRIQPLYRMALTPLRPSADLKERLYSTGMEVGVYYTLK